LETDYCHYVGVALGLRLWSVDRNTCFPIPSSSSGSSRIAQFDLLRETSERFETRITHSFLKTVGNAPDADLQQVAASTSIRCASMPETAALRVRKEAIGMK